MKHEEAALIGGLRQVVDDMLVRFAAEPSLLLQPPPRDEALLNLLCSLVTTIAIHDSAQSGPAQQLGPHQK